MPTLKNISRSIELGSVNLKLKECGHRYSDGHVGYFVAVLDVDIPFNIRVTTEGYIAPAIATFVSINGKYQCTRRQGCISLLTPGGDVGRSDYEVEFRLRQKEGKTAAGSFVTHEWTFAKLKRMRPCGAR